MSRDNSPVLPLTTSSRKETSLRYSTQKFCPECNQIMTILKSKVPRKETLIEVQKDLEESVSQGCHLCHLILQVFPASDWAEWTSLRRTNDGNAPEFIITYLLLLYTNKMEGDLSVEYEYRSEDTTIFHGRRPLRGYLTIGLQDGLDLKLWRSSALNQARFFARKTENGLRRLAPRHSIKPGSKQPVLADFSGSTGSKQTLDKAKAWIQHCNTEHAQCQIIGDPYIPSRLLEITTNSSGTTKVQLREQSGLSVDLRYCTLSHCWGQQVPMRLLRSNIAELKMIDIYRKLSPLFQDAILVTRHIGVSYIWIDSLCIIQDDEEDWLQESAQMNCIYASSYCNISAAAQSGGEQSLFATRDPQYLSPVMVKARGVTAIIQDDQPWLKAIESSPLNRRAWVLQERVLSHRNLHFTATQLFWECDTCVFSESIPSGQYLTHTPRLNSILTEAGNDPQFRERLYQAWDNLVKMYSGAKLTKERDKLIAISGIVQRLQPLLKDNYIAGLWRRTLTEKLLWSVVDSSFTSRPKAYVAPSWSWASVIGGIKMNSYPILAENRMIDIIDVKITHLGGNSYGQVDSGEIFLRGRLAKVNMLFPKSDLKHEFASFEYHTGGTTRIFKEALSYTLDVTIEDGKRIHSDNYTDIYCLPFFGGNGMLRYGGLLLRRNNIHTVQFRRLGTFFVSREIHPDSKFEACLESFVTSEEAYSMDSVQSRDGYPMYIISIV